MFRCIQICPPRVKSNMPSLWPAWAKWSYNFEIVDAAPCPMPRVCPAILPHSLVKLAWGLMTEPTALKIPRQVFSPPLEFWRRKWLWMSVAHLPSSIDRNERIRGKSSSKHGKHGCILSRKLAKACRTRNWCSRVCAMHWGEISHIFDWKVTRSFIETNTE